MFASQQGLWSHTFAQDVSGHTMEYVDEVKTLIKKNDMTDNRPIDTSSKKQFLINRCVFSSSKGTKTHLRPGLCLGRCWGSLWRSPNFLLYIQCKPKNFQAEKITISQKCVNIFLPNFAHLFTRQLRKTALCCIYLTYAKLTETQNSGTNFATAQKVDVIEVSLGA